MEECKPKQQTLERRRLDAPLKKGLVGQRFNAKAAPHVGSDASWRLIGDLDATLEDVHWELGAGE